MFKKLLQRKKTFTALEFAIEVGIFSAVVTNSSAVYIFFHCTYFNPGCTVHFNYCVILIQSRRLQRVLWQENIFDHCICCTFEGNCMWGANKVTLFIKTYGGIFLSEYYFCEKSKLWYNESPFLGQIIICFDFRFRRSHLFWNEKTKTN